jgi:hypothetical protein
MQQADAGRCLTIGNQPGLFAIRHVSAGARFRDGRSSSLSMRQGMRNYPAPELLRPVVKRPVAVDDVGGPFSFCVPPRRPLARFVGADFRQLLLQSPMSAHNRVDGASSLGSTSHETGFDVHRRLIERQPIERDDLFLRQVAITVANRGRDGVIGRRAVDG